MYTQSFLWAQAFWGGLLEVFFFFGGWSFFLGGENKIKTVKYEHFFEGGEQLSNIGVKVPPPPPLKPLTCLSTTVLLIDQVIIIGNGICV